jgi:uncharacterized protein
MKSPLGLVLPRHARDTVVEALADTRVVLVNGARQSGKSTLVHIVAKDRRAEWRNLDNALTRQAAVSDPTGFVDFGDVSGCDRTRHLFPRPPYPGSLSPVR